MMVTASHHGLGAGDLLEIAGVPGFEGRYRVTAAAANELSTEPADTDAMAAAARRRVHAQIDEECRRIKVWIGIQAAADRAHLAGKSYTRSYGQLKRWRE